MLSIDPRILEKLSQKEVWLLLHLTSILKNNNSNIITNKELMDCTKLGRNSLLQVKKSLVNKELISIEPNFDNSEARISNSYFLNKSTYFIN